MLPNGSDQVRRFKEKSGEGETKVKRKTMAQFHRHEGFFCQEFFVSLLSTFVI